MSVGACILGYSDSYVDSKVTNIIRKGVSSSLICLEEYLLAKKLIKLHPWSSKVKFARVEVRQFKSQSELQEHIQKKI